MKGNLRSLLPNVLSWSKETLCRSRLMLVASAQCVNLVSTCGHSDFSLEHNFTQSFFKASQNPLGPAFVVEVADTSPLQAAQLVAVQSPPPHGQTEAVVPVVWTRTELPGGGGRSSLNIYEAH